MRRHDTSTLSSWFCEYKCPSPCPSPHLPIYSDFIKLKTHICIHVMSWHSKSCHRIHLKTLHAGPLNSRTCEKCDESQSNPRWQKRSLCTKALQQRWRRVSAGQHASWAWCSPSRTPAERDQRSQVPLFHTLQPQQRVASNLATRQQNLAARQRKTGPPFDGVTQWHLQRLKHPHSP